MLGLFIGGLFTKQRTPELSTLMGATVMWCIVTLMGRLGSNIWKKVVYYTGMALLIFVLGVVFYMKNNP